MNAELIGIKINGKLLDKNQTAELVKNNQTAELVKLIVIESGNTNTDYLTWVNTSTDTNTQINTGYVTLNDLSRVILTMPQIIPASGQKLGFENRGIAGFQIQQQLGQTIIVGNKKTTTGIQGLIKSYDYGDFIEMEYINGNWVVTKLIGNIEIL